MKEINWTRVLLGGLAAGIIIDAMEFLLHGVVLASDWRQAMADLGRPMQETVGDMVFYVLLGLIYGILAVWLYAGIRPRYGPGPLAALVAGFAVWLLAYLLPTLSWMALDLFPGRLLAIALLVGLVEILIATLVGAWLYKESPAWTPLA